jgi:hypothetical protein
VALAYPLSKTSLVELWVRTGLSMVCTINARNMFHHRGIQASKDHPIGCSCGQDLPSALSQQADKCRPVDYHQTAGRIMRSSIVW